MLAVVVIKRGNNDPDFFVILLEAAECVVSSKEIVHRSTASDEGVR